MNYSHTELTSSIIEAAIEVQRTLGGGFSRDVFKRALVAELEQENIEAEVDFTVPLMYKGDAVGERCVDIAVEGVVCIELTAEATYRVPDVEYAMRYLRASGMNAGLLINFGSCNLDYVRMHVQGCRADILIGDSIRHLPDRSGAFSNGRATGHATLNGKRRVGKGRWLPLWLRGSRIQ